MQAKYFLFSALLLAPAAAVAQEDGRPEGTGTPVADAAVEGSYVSLLLPASTARQGAVARVLGGYDSTSEKGVFDSEVRVRLFGPVTLRGGVAYSPGTETFRPRVGAAVQFLSQGKQGLDGTVGLSYKAEGFTEPEGEIEAEVAIGRRFGRVNTVLNLAYGQDPEGNERDGELRLAALTNIGAAMHAGVAGHLRVDLGPERAAGVEEEGGEYDIVIGPLAGYQIDRFVLTAQAGLSVLKPHDGSTLTGALVVAGVGAAF